MKISLLEQVSHFEGKSTQQTLNELLELVKLADELGYERFWIAEHHNMPSLLSAQPDILIAYLLANTKKIRIGSGGIMAMHLGSLQVAEKFNMLASLYPNRVDMGIGRAPGGDLLSAHALNQGRIISPDKIDDLIEETLGIMRKNLPDDHRYKKLLALPEPEIAPEIWLLGSSGQSAELAARLNMNYAYAYFFTGTQNKNIMDYYRTYHKKYNDNLGKTLSALLIIAAETREEAEYNALSTFAFRYELTYGTNPKFINPSNFSPEYVEKIRRYSKTNNNALIGTYDEVAEQIKEFSKNYHTEEIMLITYLFDNNERLKTYRELAKRLIK